MATSHCRLADLNDAVAILTRSHHKDLFIQQASLIVEIIIETARLVQAGQQYEWSKQGAMQIPDFERRKHST
jgi:hypothetical protein